MAWSSIDRVLLFVVLLGAVTSQTPVSDLQTTKGVETTSSSRSTDKEWSTSFWASSRTDEWPEDPCYDEPLLENVCSVPEVLDDVTFWDLYSVIYSDTVLDALMLSCPEGTWCLHDKFDQWEGMIADRAEMVLNATVVQGMCTPDMITCLDGVVAGFKNCSVYPQMDYTMLSIKLICTLKSDGVTTTECMKHTLTSLHVTLADVLRLETEVQPIDNSNGDFCKSPEAHMTNGLLCMYNSCPNHADDFSQFTPWSWFMSVVDDVITQCSLDPEACVSLIQVGPKDSKVTSLTSSSQENVTSTNPSTWSTQQVMTSEEYVLNSQTNGSSSPKTETSTSPPRSTSSTFSMTSYSTSSFWMMTSSKGEAGDSGMSQHPYGDVLTNDLNMMMAITVASMVTAIVLLALVCVIYRRHRRNVVIKEGYQKLLNDGEDS